MKIENVKPTEIEARSFEIIGEILGDKKIDPKYEHIDVFIHRRILSMQIVCGSAMEWWMQFLMRLRRVQPL